MSQNYVDNCYQIDHDGPSDLQIIEFNFECLKSTFRGTSAPTSPVAGQWWYDFTHKLQRFYDGSNWLCSMTGDANQKIWSYCNSVIEGMVLVTGLTDRVLALKGGSGMYNVNGGNTAGNWTSSHTHGAGSFTVNTYHRHNLGTREYEGGMIWPASANGWCYTDYQGSTTQAVAGTSATGGDSSWRPAASIGIIQRPDL